MQSDRKNKSVLESAAEWCGQGPFPPLVKDPEKVIRDVFEDAGASQKLKRLIRKQVTDLAARDDAFRVELAKDLTEVGKIKRHRPSSYPNFFPKLIYIEVCMWREHGKAKNLTDAFAISLEIHRAEYPDLTDDAIRGIYQRELAIRRKHKTP